MDLSQIISLSSVVDATPDLKNTYWVQTLKAGLFSHWLYGDIAMDEDRFRRFSENYNKAIYGQDLHINFEHGMDSAKGLQAAGWVKDVKFDADSMSWLIEFTEDAMEEIRAKKWRYFSAEFSDVWTSEFGVKYNDVITGGALTNQPFLKGMQPLNFSDLFNKPENWEHAPEEHSEPGTGNPPVPRETPPEKDQEGGWRRDTPPFVEELEDREEVSIMDREQLVLFAEKFGIEVKDDMTDEQLLAEINTKADGLLEQVTALSEVHQEAEATKTFRETFPEAYERMRTLEKKDRENEAKSFSERYRSFSDKEGKNTGFGLSTLAVDKLNSAHLKLSEGQLTHSDLTDLLDAIAVGVVKLSESGSSRESEPKKFSEHVKDLQATPEYTDKSYKDVVSAAARLHPEAYREYLKNPAAN